jgi:type I restriction enzyme S subunit
VLEISSSKRIFLSDYVSDGIPFYRGKEIILKSKNEALNDRLFISEEKFEEIKTKYDVPKEGDILVTAVGTLGYPYLVTKSDGDFYFKDGNLIWLKGNEKVSSSYLISSFKNEHFQIMLNNIAIGSSQKALTIKSLKAIKHIIPSLPIQEKYDEIVISIYNGIENLQNQNQHLKEARDILLPRLMSGMIDVAGLEVDAGLGMVAEVSEAYVIKK